MARRTVLTGRQRDALLALPADEPTLLQHHVLNDVDLGHIRRRRTGSALRSSCAHSATQAACCNQAK